MMRFYKVFFGFRGLLACSCVIVILLTTSCNRAALSDTRASSEQAIRTLDSQWSKTAASHDVDGTVAFYADDAILLPPDEPLAGDKASIRASWAGTLPAMDTISWNVKTIEVAKSGELAYLTGAWTTTAKGPNGTPVPVIGKLLEVWKKQPIGQWKCAADIFNSDAPANPAPSSTK
ncbi:MAG TPA: DUF4440 domain-containing protein [Edaphobacter sp.]|nr:DUF4440 domain-containing protein [Edaphobacter sp.]